MRSVVGPKFAIDADYNVIIGSYMDSDNPVSYYAWWYSQGGWTRADIIVGNSISVLLSDYVFED